MPSGTLPTTPECWRGQIHSKACQDTLLTFGNHCLEEEMTFGDPFEDSSVERFNPLNLSTLSRIIPQLHAFW